MGYVSWLILQDNEETMVLGLLGTDTPLLFLEEGIAKASLWGKSDQIDT